MSCLDKPLPHRIQPSAAAQPMPGQPANVIA